MIVKSKRSSNGIPAHLCQAKLHCFLEELWNRFLLSKPDFCDLISKVKFWLDRIRFFVNIGILDRGGRPQSL